MRKRKLLSLLLSLMMFSSAIGAPVYADEMENVSIQMEDYNFDEVSENPNIETMDMGNTVLLSSSWRYESNGTVSVEAVAKNNTNSINSNMTVYAVGYDENTHEPIVSKELFDKVQRHLAETSAAYHKNLGKYDKISNNNNLFKGKIVCGDCGTNLTRYKTAKKGYKKARYTYICPHHAIFPDKCKFIMIAEDILKEIVMNSVRLQISYLANIENMLANAAKSPVVRKKMIAVTRETSSILSNIAYIKSSRIRAASDFAKGIIDEQEYKAVKDEFDAELHMETSNLEAVNKERERLNRLLSSGKWIADLKKHKSSKKLTQEIVDAFVKRITVYPDKNIEIQWAYSDKMSELLMMFSDNNANVGGERLAG